MEALVCSENWLETPNGNDGENHEPTQTTDKGKRKLDEDTCVRKKSKPSNCEKAISTEDIAKDFNNNEFNHGRNFKDVNEISSDDSSSDFDQSDQVQSSSSESDDETTLKEQGQWCEQDVRVYLVSNFTNKDYERLDKLERKKLNRKSIGRDKELNLTGDKLEHLLMVPRSTETQKKYHINEVVINAFFKLLKERSRKFSKAYINHYSFDSQAANLLIKGSRSEREVLARYKPDHLRGVHKLFLPLCLSDHWVLFYVDINAKKFSCLDPYQSSGILSFNSKNVDKILQWFKSFLLPEFGYKMQMNGHMWSVLIFLSRRK
ncbi:hypothetical protein GOBAR_AA38474 [Gossypium barbadense]|uniref:Ubiquitin-like protease family profile domain-containing protein n=1 Tax=Gossypium barbadense TaxID=3634 RepID=A0A2P5VTR8_GOSBA|nr:hypothetical protein GOBAR_AA38474 [Gossypium barbadense]